MVRLRYARYTFILEQLEKVASEDDATDFKLAHLEDDEDTMWCIAGRYPQIETDDLMNSRWSEAT